MATMGVTTVGGSTNGISANVLFGAYVVAPADGTVTSIVGYFDNWAGVNIKGVLVNSSLEIVANGVSASAYTNSVNGTWVTLTFSTPPSITASAVYYLMVIGDAAIGYKYTTAVGDDTTKTDTTNSYTTPENPTGASNYVVRASIYANYEPSGSTTQKTITAAVNSIASIVDAISGFVLSALQVNFGIYLSWTDDVGQTVDVQPATDLETVPETSSTINLRWTNPSNFGYVESILFRSSTEDLDGQDYAYCVANATEVYRGTNGGYLDTDLDVTNAYYYSVFTKYLDSGSDSYSDGAVVTTEKTVFVTDYWVAGDANWNAAIGRAHTAITNLLGGTVVFDDGDYLITNTVSLISSLKWRGVGAARLYSQKTAVYNFLIAASYKTDVIIENIIFDQRGDVDQAPTFSPYQACSAIWFSFCDNIDVHDCTFYSYGVVPFYVDCWEDTAETTKDVKFKRNYLYWEAKVDTWYDVSITHIQAKSIEYEDNYVESLVNSKVFHLARTGFECHAQNGYIKNNTFKGTQVGFLYVPVPSHWAVYDTDYEGAFLASGNTMINIGAIGIELWLGFKSNGRDIKNLTIEDNIIGLYVKNNIYSKPGAGITFYKGGPYDAEAYDVIIRRNTFSLTYDTSYYASLTAVRSQYYLQQYGENTGVFCLNVAHTLRRVSIYDNTVSQFPYSLLNLYRRNGSSTIGHDDIECYDNESVNSHYAEPYTNITTSKHCFTLGIADTVSITGNVIQNPNIALQGQKEELLYLTNLTYSGNTFT